MTLVSIIVPCYNEQANIYSLLEAVACQTFPLNEIEVIIADGMSTDRTRTEINRFVENHPQLRVNVIDNSKKIIPAGLNRAIEVSQGRYLVRLDAHSIPDPEYIKNCVSSLEAGLGDNVGGIWRINAGESTWVAKSIAIAASHPIAAGDALYRIGGTAREVDTVPFGAYRHELVEKIGMFDESLLSNEDYEFNARIRQAGGKVWLDPSIKSTYISRSTLKELSRQYWRYGYWKAQMLRKYPQTLRLRQAIPPLFVISLLFFGVLSFVVSLARWLLAIIVLLYGSILLIIGIQMALKHRNPSAIIGVPLAIVSMHFSWGCALIWGLMVKPAVLENQK